MKIVRVDILKKLIFVSIEEKQKLNIFVVNYIPSKNKTKSGQSRINKKI